MEKKWIVYTISLGSKVMYVGKCVNWYTRKSLHKTRRGTFQSAIPLDVDLSLVEFNKVSEFTDEFEALEFEDKLIDRYDTIDNGWNKRHSGGVFYSIKREMEGEEDNLHKSYCKAYRKMKRDELENLKKENAMLKAKLKAIQELLYNY